MTHGSDHHGASSAFGAGRSRSGASMARIALSFLVIVFLGDLLTDLAFGSRTFTTADLWHTGALTLVLSAIAGPICWSQVSRVRRERSRAEASVGRDLAALAHVRQDLDMLKAAIDEHAIVAITDASGKIIEVNQKFIQISGYSEAELIGRTHNVINSGTHPKSFFVEMWRTIASGRVWHGEICNRTKAGSLYWVSTTIAPVRGPDGKIVRFVSIRADITARKIAEQELAQSKERCDLAVEGSSDGLWDLNLVSGHCWYSDRILAMYGYTREDVPPTIEAWTSRIHAEDSEKTLSAFQSHLLHDTPYDVEFRMLAKSGEYRWCRSRGRAVRDETGKAIRIAGTIIDIHDRREAERRLGEQKALLQLFVEHAPAAVVMLDKEMRYVTASRRWRSDFNLEGREWLGKSHYELFPDMPERWKQIHRRCLEGHVERNDHDVWRHPRGEHDQHLRWEVRPWFTPTSDGTEIGGIMIYSEDLTETMLLQAKLAENAQRLDMALDAGGLGWWDWDVKSNMVEFDDRFAAQLGLTQDERRVHAETWLKRLHPDDVGAAARAVQEHLAGKTPTYVNEHRARHRDGSWRWILDCGKVVARANDGTPTRMVGTHQDITERKSIEENLRELTKAAEAANVAKSEFLTNMSHEIRTPLTSILGYADLLNESIESPGGAEQRREIASTIRAAGQHLMAVVSDILDLSRIESGAMGVEESEVDLPGLLASVHTLLLPKAQAKGITLELLATTSIPAWVRTDPTRLRQILINLAGNAVKFTDKGSIVIAASCELVDGRSMLVMDVTDSGPGLTPEQATVLFRPFSQADSSITRRQGGCGLGLVISRKLATMLGGSVTLERTSLGKGSTFRAVVPIWVIAGSSLTTTFKTESKAQPIARRATSLAGRILLVEDGLDNQRLVAFHLRKAGAEVDVADNGRIALEKLDEAARATPHRPYDMILSDMQMPEMDGYTTARTLRSRGSSVPIIALTAHAMSGDRQKCLDAGCDDYISKPVDKAHLLGVCAVWIARARLADEHRRAA